MYRSLLLLFAGLLLQRATFAQTNNRGLDLSFGNQGIVIDSYVYDYVHSFGYFHAFSDIILQPNGKIIGVGNYVARYNANGSFDSSFGTTGHVRLDSLADSLTEYGYRLALQADGKILVCGMSEIWINSMQRGGFLLRLNPDGSLDSAFGNNGKVLFCCGYQHVLLQPDGNIIVAGGSNVSVILRRFKPDGSYDSSFGINGYIETGNNLRNSMVNLDIMSDGRIITSGQTEVGASTVTFYARYKPDGSLDSSLGGAGLIYGEHIVFMNDFKLQPGGEMVYALGSFFFSSDAEVRRRKADGSTDSSFGINGSLPVPGMTIKSLWLMPDGRILCGGYNDSDYVLCRLKPDGQGVDSSFGIHGVISTDLVHWNSERPYTMEVQSDGRIILAGYSKANNVSPTLASMVRYNADAYVSVPTLPTAERPTLRLYPNPAGNTLWAEAPSYAPGGVIRTYDAVGSLLLSRPFEGGRTTLNLADLPAGMYILRWQGAAQKFIKQ
jgi:uncharacterized delta-60 repeat protein